MRMMIDGTEVSAVWEENESVKALEEMCRKQELKVQMSRYGGFEQVEVSGKVFREKMSRQKPVLEILCFILAARW